MARAFREPPQLPGFRHFPFRAPRAIGTVSIVEPDIAMVEASAAASQSSANVSAEVSVAAADGAPGAR
eukprot:10379818-Lingulodinium_polyedra.AAC.1